MHCTITTIAHRLTSHTHPIPVHQQNQQTRVDSTRLTPPFSPPRRAMSNRPGPISLFGGQASSSCSAADSSGMQQNLIRPPLDHLDWLPSCFSTMDLRPEPTAHSVHLLPRLIVLCPCTSVSGVRGARDRLKPRGSCACGRQRGGVHLLGGVGTAGVGGAPRRAAWGVGITLQPAGPGPVAVSAPEGGVAEEDEAGRRRAAVVEARRRRKAEAKAGHKRAFEAAAARAAAVGCTAVEHAAAIKRAAAERALIVAAVAALERRAADEESAVPWPPWPLSSMGAARSRTPPSCGPPEPRGGRAGAGCAGALWGCAVPRAGGRRAVPGEAAGGGRACALAR
jgi:hypothetical protein